MQSGIGARRLFCIAGLCLLALAGCSKRSGHPARIATGYISHVVCSYVFVSGLDPARVNAEDIAGNPVFTRFHWALRHAVDRDQRQVTAWAFGLFESRAIYRDGVGCLNLNGMPAAAVPTPADVEADGPITVLLPEIAGESVVKTTDVGLEQALARAYAEPAGKIEKRTHAVVVVHDGRVVAERYANGFGIDTPVHGWSATKSVNNALLGILVRQGKLDMQEPAPVPVWQASTDPRHARRARRVAANLLQSKLFAAISR